MIKNYNELLSLVQKAPIAKVAVTASVDSHTIEAALEAGKQKIAEPIFIGDTVVIKRILEQLGEDPLNFEMIHEPEIEKTPIIANNLIHSEHANFVMKGFIDTSIFLKGILDKETGLRTGNALSHVAFLELPGYKKLLAVTDAGMIPAPDFSAKLQIVENAVRLLNNMGCVNPKIAALAAVEKENKSMPETSDALALHNYYVNSMIGGCEIDGPVSYDIAISKEAARIKGVSDKNSEEYDIFLVPNISAGNILVKALIYHAGAKMAGIVAGAKVPLVLNSRSASSEEKFYAILLAAAVSMLSKQP
jgi:phosphate butyryltransferase